MRWNTKRGLITIYLIDISSLLVQMHIYVIAGRQYSELRRPTYQCDELRKCRRYCRQGHNDVQSGRNRVTFRKHLLAPPMLSRNNRLLCNSVNFSSVPCHRQQNLKFQNVTACGFAFATKFRPGRIRNKMLHYDCAVTSCFQCGLSAPKRGAVLRILNPVPYRLCRCHVLQQSQSCSKYILTTK